MTEQRARELLKPCPFCGSPGKKISVLGEWLTNGYGPNGARIVCTKTDCSGTGWAFHGANQDADAIAAWNTRAALSTPFAESAKSPSDSVSEALTVEAYNDLYDPADEAGQETFSNGFREGFLYARYPEGYDQEDAALALAEIEDIAMGEAWGGYRDDFFRRLPIAAIPDQSEIGKPLARAALQSSEDQGNG